MVVARLSGRVRRVPRPGVVVERSGRGGWLGGGGAADVHGGGGGVGGDVAGGVTERLSGLDLVGAVSVPVRMEVIRVRRVVVKDRCRAWTGCPARGPLANGVARAAVDRVAAWRSSVATIQAACS